MEYTEVKEIAIKDLVLWVKTPRDEIDSSASDQDIATRATSITRGKWKLRELARSEDNKFYCKVSLPSPIVVIKEGKPIVYDGNRRILLAKIKLGYVKVDPIYNTPNFPEAVYCDIMSEEQALRLIYERHTNIQFMRRKTLWGEEELTRFLTISSAGFSLKSLGIDLDSVRFEG